MDQPVSAVIVGLDVGKQRHHAVITRPDGTIVHDRVVANTEADLVALLTEAEAEGPVLLVVDQPASIGALPVAVAQHRGITVTYLPGRTMRQVADTFPGEAKTDARDAWIIAEAARTMPHTIRALAVGETQAAELRVLCGCDDDLVRQMTALTNRIRGLLTQIHPPLERVLGPKLAHRGVLELLAHWPTPAQLGAARPRHIAAFLTRRGSRSAPTLAAHITDALTQQTVEIAGTASLGLILPLLVAQLTMLRDQRAEIGRQIERVMVTHPLCPIVRSLDGFGPKTTARTLVELDGKTFASAAELAAYAGVAPVTRQSGTSIRQHRRPRKGNKALKTAFYQAAFASLRHPPSRVYYDKKRQAGKRHEQALLALARRRVDVLFALIWDGALYQAPDLDPPLTKT